MANNQGTQVRRVHTASFDKWQISANGARHYWCNDISDI